MNAPPKKINKITVRLCLGAKFYLKSQLMVIYTGIDQVIEHGRSNFRLNIC